MNWRPIIALRILPFGILCAILVTSALGQSAPKLNASRSAKSAPARKTAVAVASQAELNALRQTIENQHIQDQQQLDALRLENRSLGEQLKAADERLAQADEKLSRLAEAQSPQIAALESAVKALQSSAVATANIVRQEQTFQLQSLNPLALHYRAINIVPGGFFAGESLYRSHAQNADINTTWNSIPFSAQSMAYLSEFRASSRQTRLSLRAEGPIGSSTVTGYFETDFLGSGFGASEVQTNGYSNRVRQMWGRIQLPTGWTIAAGQMWSLLTTNRIGIDNLAEMTPALIDATVLPGFDYARQTAIRVTGRFNRGKATAAFSAENAATVGVTPVNVPSSISSNLSGLSTIGTGVMSNTTYSTNVAPDLIAKVALDPGFGHYEIRAIGRTFRDRLDATATTAGKNNTLLGGGIGGAAYLPVWKDRINYLMQGSWGALGRYAATSTDVIVKPNGILSAEKSIHGISGLDVHPDPRLDAYAYAADEYLPRNYGYGAKTIDNTKCFIEAGFSCSASVRNLQATAAGFWYRFYKGSAGTVQYGAGYIYVAKDTWVGLHGAPRGIENVVETSLRYYLP